MKILHAIPFLWSGAGAVVTRLCEDQSKAGAVHIVTTGRIDRTLEDWQPYRRRLRKAGVAHHRINLFKRDPEAFWNTVENFSRLLAFEAPSIIHAHAGVPTAVAAISIDRLGLGIPIVAHMYNWRNDRPAWMNTMDFWAFSQADRVVCSARDYEALLLDNGISKRRLIYLPWGLPAEPACARKIDPKAPVVGCVGRIEPRKNQMLLIDAVERLRARVPGVRLELIGPTGDEDYAKSVRTRLENRDTAGFAVWKGAVRDVSTHLRRWSVFASASDDEGQGLAIQEAMACGIPVVVRRAAGVVDFVTDHKTGWLFSGNDPGSLADTLESVLRHPREAARAAAAAERLIRRTYSWNAMAKRLNAIYRELVRRSGSVQPEAVKSIDRR